MIVLIYNISLVDVSKTKQNKTKQTTHNTKQNNYNHGDPIAWEDIKNLTQKQFN
jgi:hypothetical protein